MVVRPRSQTPALEVRMSARRTLRGCTVATLFTLAGCQSSKTTPDTPAAAAPTINLITVTASDFHFDAPAETPAGPTTIRLVNNGPSIHHVQLLKLEDGKTPDDFIAALKAGGPEPRW